MKKVFAILLGASLLFGAGSVYADAASDYNKCVGCHGANGKSGSDTYPSLNGQRAGYLLKQMNDIASKKRKNSPMLAAMVPAVKGMSGDQRKALAKWLSEK